MELKRRVYLSTCAHTEPEKTPGQPTRSSLSAQLKKHGEDTAKERAQIPVSSSRYNGQMSGKSKKENNLCLALCPHTHPSAGRKIGQGHIPAAYQLSGPGDRQMPKYWSLSVLNVPSQTPPWAGTQKASVQHALASGRYHWSLPSSTFPPYIPITGTSPPFLNSSSMASSLVSLKTKCSGWL